MSTTSARFRSTLILVLIFVDLQVSCIDLRFLRKRTEGTITVPTTTTSTSTTATSSVPNCTEGVWSEWNEVLRCNAECGSCGSRVFRRNCTTADCPCRGDTRREERCNIQVCDYPKPACCPPYKLMLIEGEFACGPQDKIVRFLDKENRWKCTLAPPRILQISLPSWYLQPILMGGAASASNCFGKRFYRFGHHLPLKDNSLAAFTAHLKAMKNQSTMNSTAASTSLTETPNAHHGTSTTNIDELLLIRKRK